MAAPEKEGVPKVTGLQKSGAVPKIKGGVPKVTGLQKSGGVPEIKGGVPKETEPEKTGDVPEKETFRVSVRELVAAGRQDGDLSGAYVGRQRAMDGIREHGRIADLRPDGYRREVRVSGRVETDRFTLEVHGRIDGILEADGRVMVEEIKSCRTDPAVRAGSPDPLHLAQLKCYGHLYAAEYNLDCVTLVLTYAHTLSDAMDDVRKTADAGDLADFFEGLTAVYIRYISDRSAWRRIRNLSIRDLAFPYPDFRQGQRDLAEAVYKIIKHQKILFARAPTGTGKTIATLFPAIKSLGLNQTDKLFYLTAKTLGRTVAKKAVQDMGKKGLRLKTILLTAKQKICPVSDDTCDMETCDYAQAYYTKLNRAMAELAHHDIFDGPLLADLGERYTICPFELSLDLSESCDLIVCDLNYAFDPRVSLKRYFEQDGGIYTFLIDEAHNLPDRLRSMYSADLTRNDILGAQTLTRDAAPRVSQALSRINKTMIRLRNKHLGAGGDHLRENDAPGRSRPDDPDRLAPRTADLPDLPEEFMEQVDAFCTLADNWLDRNPESPIRREFMNYYFEAGNFLTIARFFGETYRFFIESSAENLRFRLFCIDPSPIFSRLIQRGKSAIFFSATFYPKTYYQTLLFGEDIDPYAIVLPSPFPEENLRVIIRRDIQTTLRQRHRFHTRIARAICETVRARPGNYLVFFPSYAYMNQVREALNHADLYHPDLAEIVRVQAPGMTEPERQDFLDAFQPDSETIGFAVMGGIFGEGIDLTGDCLVGVIVVGVGLPQICPEQERIRTYYDAGSGDGFFNAYQMPGFNRVLQAAGRLIRTETDRGVVILMDSRFLRPGYCRLFPAEWRQPDVLGSDRELQQALTAFWDETLP